MPEETLVIANPTSGGGRGRKSAETAATAIESVGRRATVSYTSASGDAALLAREALDRGIQRMAVCGGDGTIHEVIGVLAGSDVEVGLIPCGRGNDFARALGIPASPDEAGRLIATGSARRVDLGMVNDRYFATVVTMGFDSEVARLVYERAVPFKGTAAYVLGVLKMLIKYAGIHAKIHADFGTIDQPVLLMATGNTAYYGGGMKIAPDADYEDGLLDICHVRMMSRLGVLRLLPAVFWGGHVGRPGVTTARSSKLQIETDSPVWLFADGEPVCQTPAVVRAVPKALSVIDRL